MKLLIKGIAMLLVVAMAVGLLPAQTGKVCADEVYANEKKTKMIYPGNNYEVTYHVTSNWNTGYNVDVNIKNTGTKNIEDWYIVFDHSDEITNIWNAEIYNELYGYCVVSHKDYNYAIKPGESANFGFTCTGTFNELPTNVILSEPVLLEFPGKYEVIYEETANWISGFTGNIHIKNNSEFEISGWELTFDSNASITSFWNGELKEKTDSGYIIKGLSYNRKIKPGEEVVFGIMGTALTSIISEGKVENPVLSSDVLDATNQDEIDEDIVNNYQKELEKQGQIDSDEDGISNLTENYFNLDINRVDTDEDGLSDYLELSSTGTNGALKDSDENGILDGDEDSDEDGLTNLEELKLGTDCGVAGTDGDALIDGDEIYKYHTNPLQEDTDEDGVDDGKEVEMGTNPTKADETFEASASSMEEDTVKVSVDVKLKGEQVSSLSVERYDNEVFFPETMPGYLGGAYEFKCEGEFEEATLSFEFDKELLDDEDFDPVIYYFNEEEQKLEALDTTVEGNVAKAKTPHFSKYVLINRTVFEDSLEWIDEWDADGFSSMEVEFIFDNLANSYERDKAEEYRNLMLEKADEILECLPEASRVCAVDFYSNTVKLYGMTEGIQKIDTLLESSYEEEKNTRFIQSIINSIPNFNVEDNKVKKIVVLFTTGYNSGAMAQHYYGLKNAINGKNISFCPVIVGYDEYGQAQSYKKIANETDGTYAESYLSKYYTDTNEEISNDVYNQIIFVNSVKTLDELEAVADVEKKIMDAQPKYTKFGAINARANINATMNHESLLEPTSNKQSVINYISSLSNIREGIAPIKNNITLGLQDAIKGFSSRDSRVKRKIVIVTTITNDHSIDTGFLSRFNVDNVQINTIILGSPNGNPSYKGSLTSLANVTGGSVIPGVAYLAFGKDEMFHLSHSGTGGVKLPVGYRWLCDISPIKEYIENINVGFDIETDTDQDGISDFYENNMTIFNGIHYQTDYLNPDTDNDGVSDGEEFAKVELEYSEDGKKVLARGKLISDPRLQDSDFDGTIDLHDLQPFSNCFIGKMYNTERKEDRANLTFQMDYRWFLNENTNYQSKLSKMSIILSSAAYHEETVEINGAKYDINKLLKRFGMKNVKTIKIGNGNDVHKSEVSLGYTTVIKGRTIKNVVAVVVRGTDASIEEWSSNFEIGNMRRFHAGGEWKTYNNHEGFDITANRIMEVVNEYVEECKKEIDNEEPFTYWITGHSRGAGIANIIGAYYEDQNKEAFTYTFASPNTTLNDNVDDYKTIFNVVNTDDMIPLLPLESWGYSRYGRTIKDRTGNYRGEWNAHTAHQYVSAKNKVNKALKAMESVVPIEKNSVDGVRKTAYEYWCDCHGKRDGIKKYEYSGILYPIAALQLSYINQKKHKTITQYSNTKRTTIWPFFPTYVVLDICQKPAYFMQYLAVLMSKAVVVNDFPQDILNGGKLLIFLANMPLAFDYNLALSDFLSAAMAGNLCGVKHPHDMISYYVLANNIPSKNY
ncbi:MAG: cellulose binding domain-containing protein [Eubacterium sp.]|nr:cellulose binding domain-containing protein [Eubacterium sp.]